MSDPSIEDICDMHEERERAARAEGYREALDDVYDAIRSDYHADDMIGVDVVTDLIEHLKSAYEKGSDGNGK